MERLSLELHPEKTRILELGLGKEGFVFLGCYLRIVLSHFKRREYLFRWPSPQAMNRIRARIRALTDRRRRAGMKDIREVISDLNPVPRGWGNYFRTGNASLKLQQVDLYVNQRLVRLLRHVRGCQRRPFSLHGWSPAFFANNLGLSTRRDDSLSRFGECHMTRSSLSRVREIRMHGLKGGFRSPGSQEHRA